MNEAETYNFVTSEKRKLGYGSGVYNEYAFINERRWFPGPDFLN